MATEDKVINSTTVFATLSAYIYFIWFQFENGICNHYKIPNYFITPSITGLLICATSILAILGTSLKALGLSTPLFRKLKDPTQGHLHGIYFMNGLAISIGILVLYTFPLSLSLFLSILGLLVLFNLLTWVIPYLFKWNQKKSFEEKITEAMAEGREDQFSILNLFDFKFTRNQYFFGIILIILPFVTYTLGIGVATSQKTHQLVGIKKNTVILKKFDDFVLCRSFDSITKTFSDSLLILKMSDNEEYILTEYQGILMMK